jgi:hypothetical protein
MEETASQSYQQKRPVLYPNKTKLGYKEQNLLGTPGVTLKVRTITK